MGICFVPRFCRYGKFALILSFLAVIATGIGARNTTTKELSSDSQPSYLAGQSSSHNPSFAEGYGNLPLRFEPNNGQSPRSVMFLCRGATSSLFFTKTEAVLMMPVLDRHIEELKQPPAFPFRRRAAFSRPERVAVVRLSFLDISPKVEVSAIGKLRSVSNYFMWNDPSGWRWGFNGFRGLRRRSGKCLCRGVSPGWIPHNVWSYSAKLWWQWKPIQCQRVRFQTERGWHRFDLFNLSRRHDSIRSRLRWRYGFWSYC